MKEGCQKRFFQLIIQIMWCIYVLNIRVQDILQNAGILLFLNTKQPFQKPIQIHRIDRIYINSARISNDTTNNILITRVLSTVVDRAFREGVREEEKEEKTVKHWNKEGRRGGGERERGVRRVVGAGVEQKPA